AFLAERLRQVAVLLLPVGRLRLPPVDLALEVRDAGLGDPLRFGLFAEAPCRDLGVPAAFAARLLVCRLLRRSVRRLVRGRSAASAAAVPAAAIDEQSVI